MDEALRSKLAADIDKSGFGSEMRGIRTFLSKGWGCTGAQAYYDQDEGKTREIDISACTLVRQFPKLNLEYHIRAEVKKTERPWIVFRHQDDKAHEGDAWINPFVHAGLPCDLSELSPQLIETSTRKRTGWLARGIHEAFKDPSQPSRWYSAFVSACKASEDYVNHECFDPETLKGVFHETSFLAICNPIVILDGLLISAKLSKDGEIELDEIGFAPFEFNFRSAKYTRGEYRIDLVTLNSLAQYMDWCQERATKLGERINELHQKGKPQ